MTENGLLECISSIEAQQARDSREASTYTQLVQLDRDLLAQGISVPMATTGSKTLFEVLSKHPAILQAFCDARMVPQSPVGSSL